MSGLDLDTFGFRSSIAIATMKLSDGTYEPTAAEFNLEGQGPSIVRTVIKGNTSKGLVQFLLIHYCLINSRFCSTG